MFSTFTAILYAIFKEQPSFEGKFCKRFRILVGVAGLEPATSSLSGTRSNQLSYTPFLMLNSEG